MVDKILVDTGADLNTEWESRLSSERIWTPWI